MVKLLKLFEKWNSFCARNGSGEVGAVIACIDPRLDGRVRNLILKTYRLKKIYMIKLAGGGLLLAEEPGSPGRLAVESSLKIAHKNGARRLVVCAHTDCKYVSEVRGLSFLHPSEEVKHHLSHLRVAGREARKILPELSAVELSLVMFGGRRPVVSKVQFERA